MTGPHITRHAIERADAPSIALSLPDTLAYQDWVDLGRDLALKRRSIDWLLGDWITFGREHFAEQIEMALGDVVGDEIALRRIEKTVRAFPPHLRDQTLSFDHHAHVADLPTQEALPLLKMAREERMNARRFRLAAMDFKVDTGRVLPREDDAEDDAMLALVRSWNRAPKSVRTDFAEMVAASHLGLIEFEAAKDED